MHVKSIISAVALSAALAVSGPVFAQTMVGGMSISETDMARVQALCTDLQNAASNTTAGTNEESGTASTDGGSTSETTATPNGVDQTLSDVDLAKITLQDCTDAQIGSDASVTTAPAGTK